MEPPIEHPSICFMKLLLTENTPFLLFSTTFSLHTKRLDFLTNINYV